MIYLKSVDSTQKFIISNYKNIPINEYVISKVQTSGYGRTGLWDSSYKNMYFSKLVLYDDFLWIRVLVSMYEICKNYVLSTEISLPNDIYAGGKKIGGFIIEPVEKLMVIGVGINLEEHETKSKTSLEIITNKKINLFEFSNEFNKILDENLIKDINEIHNAYLSGINIINTQIKFMLRKTSEKKEGIVNSIYYDKICIDNIQYRLMEIKIL